ncbi:MAG: alpha/beta hydrolase-fold protein [Cyclobacteriaceae bacterium]
MIVKSILLAFLLTASLSYGQTAIRKLNESTFSIGRSVQLESVNLEEIRTINIYLPTAYSNDSTKIYPVIYLLDGSKDEDFIHIAGLVQFGSFPWIDMLPESIVVGIGNVDRKRDFTFPSSNARDRKDFPTSGRSERFIEFLQNELQPFIRSAYKVSDRETIIGQSLGGLLATEILLRKPDLFDHYIIVSPSLWWSDEKLLKKQPIAPVSTPGVYIAVGKEGEVMKRTARELFEKLRKGENKITNLHFEFLESKTHGDALHMAVYNAFEKLYAIEPKQE